jgi:inorganic pyrophosphatase
VGRGAVGSRVNSGGCRAQDSARLGNLVPGGMTAADLPPPPASIDVVVEVPRGSFIKWGADGGVDFVSPFPCPFDYGSAPAFCAPDGDPADAVLLGGGRGRGWRGRLPVVGRVRFVDGGQRDDKWVCSARGLERRHRLALIGFFRVYALAKRWTGRGPARFEGLDQWDSGSTAS